MSKLWGILILMGVLSQGFIYFNYQRAITNIDRVQLENERQKFKLDCRRVEEFFSHFYRDLRAISLLPCIRGIEHPNLPKGAQSAVELGWFNKENEATIQQIYNTLALNAPVSEIYCVRKNFNWKQGETPFFMYDSLILGGTKETEDDNNASEDFPEEMEDEEYEVICEQLEKFSINHPRITTNPAQLPASISRVVRTCDNSQYYSKTKHQSRDARGIVYSVPFYDNNGSFSGVMCAIIRIEALLRDEPFLVITEKDKLRAKSLNFTPRPEPSRLKLTEGSGFEGNILVHDRTLSSQKMTPASHHPSKMLVEQLKGVVNDTPLELHYEVNWSHAINEKESAQTYSIFLAVATCGLMIIIGYHLHVEKNNIASIEASRREAEAASLAKSQFLANMSHEIRTPLNGIIGSAKLMMDSREQMEMKELNNMIYHSASSLLSIINDILDLSKIESGKMQIELISVDLKLVLGDVVKLFEHQVEDKGLTLEVDYPSSSPQYIISDPTRLRQVLINLVSNAIKFTERGGVSITVSFSPIKSGEHMLKFEIRDTGIGMTQEQMAKIF